MSFNKGWKEYKIGNIVEVNISSINSSKKNFDYINYLNTGNLNEGQIEELEFYEINDENIPSRAKRVVQKNDIIYSTVRPKQKHYGIINKEYNNLIVSTGFAVLSPDTKKIIPEFLYRYLTQDEIVEYLHNVAETSTSAYPSITPSVIEKLKIKAPSLKEQKKIANILSTLDKKIENNNRMNKTLEKMAQAIYKNWFIDFEPFQDEEFVESELGNIPEGWKVKKLKDIFTIQNGYAFKSKDYQKEGIKVTRTLNINDNHFIDNKKVVYLPKKFWAEKYSKYRLNKFDVVMVMVGASVGKYGIVMEHNIPSLQNQNMWRFRSKKESINQPFVFSTIKNLYDIALKWATGSARNYLRKGDFGKLKVLIPSEEILEKYYVITEPLFEKINNNLKENQSLKELRDSLLPKLMSGEIKVPLNEDSKDVN